MGAGRLERLPSGRRRTSPRRPVGQPRVGDAGLAEQRRRRRLPIASSRLSISVSTRETKNDATEWILDRSWPVVVRLLQPGEVGVHHAAVALEAEDQRDVDADALGRASSVIAGQPSVGGRDLDEHVGPVDLGATAPWPRRWCRRCRGPGRARPRWRPGRRRRWWRRRPASTRRRRCGRRSVVSSKTASSTSAPSPASSRTCSSYRSPLARAPAKIVGFVVTPTTCSSLTRSARLPVSMRSRDRSSSQMETPASESSWSWSVMVFLLDGDSGADWLSRRHRGCCPRPRRPPPRR